LETDGTAVLRSLPDGNEVWSTRMSQRFDTKVEPTTTGHLEILPNGLMTLYSKAGLIVYQTPRLSVPCKIPSLQLQDDYNLVIYCGHGDQPLVGWASNTNGGGVDRLLPDNKLKVGQSVVQDGDTAEFWVNADGTASLVQGPEKEVVWTTRTEELIDTKAHPTRTGHLELLRNGQLTLYSTDGDIVYQTPSLEVDPCIEPYMDIVTSDVANEHAAVIYCTDSTAPGGAVIGWASSDMGDGNDTQDVDDVDVDLQDD